MGDINRILDSVSAASTRDEIAKEDPRMLAWRVARADRLTVARGQSPVGAPLDRATHGALRGDLHGADHRPATASSVDRADRDRHEIARQWADRATTGSLVKLRFRAKDGSNASARVRASVESADQACERLTGQRAAVAAEIARLERGSRSEKRRARSLRRLITR